MSIKNKINLACGVFVLLLAAPLTATATDFTFNVPVNLQNQNDLFIEGEVICFAQRTDGTRKNLIGEGVQFFSLDTLGNFQGTLTVAFNANANEEPADANFYTCVLRLKDRNNGNYIEAPTPVNVGNYRVEGTI